ncbi:MAG: UDP-N-acetylglucosamine--N-acetylmuramyl-(pentapeptide) pyrophosphoryl-undecaprenol N-acetylglucosamine transferase [Actinomycetota bacterium]|nr:UDP-N-acetylglucosamine--N-acetylmuramyl-(pentapeptide) pyrophosphoryl-undecaprenol N-acetylglucosamine transferase [Actinomycetota bacterium]
MPALTIADALRDRGVIVSFVGTAERAEATLVPEAGYEIDFLRIRGIDRSNPLRAAGALALAARAVPAARKILRDRQAQAVLGGGGYVAAPVGLAAARLGLALVLSEADRHLGLANRLLARRARRVCLAFPIPGLDGGRYVVTGRPVPRAIIEADRGAARSRFGIDTDERCLLVFGGSQGALSLNTAVLDGLLDPGTPIRVLHITGRRDFELVAARVAEASAEDRFTVIPYVPDLGEALAACDLVLARSGASVFELAAAARPAILVPYPYATGRHQHLNADWMAEAGAAVVVEDSELDGARVRTLVSELLSDATRLGQMADASASLAMPDAAARVAGEILDAVGAGQ